MREKDRLSSISTGPDSANNEEAKKYLIEKEQMKLTCDNLQAKIDSLEKSEDNNKKQITSLNTKILQFEQDTLNNYNKLKESNEEKKMLHSKIGKLEG